MRAVDVSGNASDSIPVVVELDCTPPQVIASDWDGATTVTVSYTETVDPATLVVGESGRVEAEIDCGVVSIRGRVSGQVRGRERIELLAGAQVHATLCSPRLAIEEGAFFEGDCRMDGDGAEAKEAPGAMQK